MPTLVVLEGPCSKLIHSFDEGAVLIGRGLKDVQRRHLPLDKDLAVSEPLPDGSRAAHARVYGDGGNWRVQDLGSLNGTEVLLEGMRLKLAGGAGYPIQDGDMFCCGESLMLFRSAVDFRLAEDDLERAIRKAKDIRLRVSLTDAAPSNQPTKPLK